MIALPQDLKNFKCQEMPKVFKTQTNPNPLKAGIVTGNFKKSFLDWCSGSRYRPELSPQYHNK
jgi:hypothetical protein